MSQCTYENLPPKPVKVVICGSFKDTDELMRLRFFILTLLHFECEVYPTPEHIENSKPLIAIHHYGTGEESVDTYKLRNEMMEAYFRAIEQCEIVVVYNIKDGMEYIGSGALMEIGYAHSLRKKVWFMVKPRDDNVLSMWNGEPYYIMRTTVDEQHKT